MKAKVIIFLLIIISINGCTKKGIPLFDIPYRGTIYIQNAWLPVIKYGVPILGIVGNIDSTTKANGTNLDTIGIIQPRSMRLQGVLPGEDFGFVSDVEVRITAGGGLGSQIIFFRDQVPIDTGNKLDLVPNNVDAKPYLRRKDWSIEVRLTLRESPGRYVVTQVDYSFTAFQ